MPEKTKIIIVDDHPIVREGMVKLINQTPDLAVCAQADNATEALQLLPRHDPNLLIVDISLKGSSSGIELIKEVRLHYPTIPILALSMHDEELYAERALRAGAQGYIMKQEATEKMLDAIRKVLKGQIFLSEKMSTRMVQEMVVGKKKNRSGSIVDLLTDRELEVFELVGQGFNSRQIAEKLHLSKKTIDTHKGNIKDKLKLKSSSQLAYRAIQWFEAEGPR